MAFKIERVILILALSTLIAFAINSLFVNAGVLVEGGAKAAEAAAFEQQQQQQQKQKQIASINNGGPKGLPVLVLRQANSTEEEQQLTDYYLAFLDWQSFSQIKPMVKPMIDYVSPYTQQMTQILSKIPGIQSVATQLNDAGNQISGYNPMVAGFGGNATIPMGALQNYLSG